MLPEEEMMEQVKALLIKRSKEAVEQARQVILKENIKNETLYEALRYFMEEFWYDASHPTLLSLGYEAVGGDLNATIGVGASFVLLAGAADIHDDVIDQSLNKDKMTVFGKFGKDIAIISGNVLWLKGMLKLEEACDSFPEEKKVLILNLTKQAFFDIGSAEAQETILKGNLNVTPEEYLEIIGLKVSVATAAAQIGAVIGNGTEEQVKSLGEYAKNLATLMTIRDEFIDMFELDELTNRFKNECLPLPMLYTFQDINLKKRIVSSLQKGVSEEELQEMLELVYASPPVKKLVDEMKRSVREGLKMISWVRENNDFGLLLKSTLQGLEY
jgi:octaprenyl-diphosphate synthase